MRFLYLGNKVRKSIEIADHIIAISDFTKKELIDIFNIKCNKITVIHEAINRNFFTKKNINDYDPVFPMNVDIKQNNFLLTVGHIEPRKNYINLIKAFNKIGDSRIKLIIVGKKNHGYKKILKLIKENRNILYLNFIEPELLLWLYKNARFFVFPSFFEGFGFPPLEAAALGTVSLVSNASSMPEVCGNSAFYSNPFSVDELTEALNTLLTEEDKLDEKRNLLEENLGRFSWKKNVEETLKLYNSILPPP
jgi:glycosyltransferase involved in cell wall biosynthesis